MKPIKFGTDGWRGVIAEDFTFENVSRVAQAAAKFWRENPVPGTAPVVVIGYDRRFMSEDFARLSAEIIAANGLQVYICDEAQPTPVISFAVKNLNAIGGVMITASHNPPRFNGFKLKAYFGGSAPPEICRQVEELLDKEHVQKTDLDSGIREGKIRIFRPERTYIKAVKKLVDFNTIARARLKVAHDAMFGSAAGWFEKILRDTTCEVITINGTRDPLFGGINPEPIEKNYVYSKQFLRKFPQDICIATDGDGDRIGALDGHGRAFTTHQVICLVLYHLLKNRKSKGRVVKALTTTSMVDKICEEYGLQLTETGVGFKYICAEMLKGDVLLGAEESGGIGVAGHIPERDGIVAGLMLLELLAVERKSPRAILAQLHRKYGLHVYDRIDINYPLEKRHQLIDTLKQNPPEKLLSKPVVKLTTFDGVKMYTSDGSWLMFRPSGTEPILRIYAESNSTKNVNGLLSIGLKIAKRVAGQK